MSKKGMLTIKEFADSLDLPKSKINYQVSKLDSNYIVVLNGIKHLTEDGQMLIIKALGLKDTFENCSNLNSNLNSFEQLFEHFESQLKSKDKQIDKLHTLLDQQQQLTLQRDKQIDKLQCQLETKENGMSDSEKVEKDSIKNQPKKIENGKSKETASKLSNKSEKGFWQRLFNT